MTKFHLSDDHKNPLLLESLVDTRMLIQANSGGGKSWAIRRLLESTHGMLQHLVIDREGEFASLREKHDYVLAAATGGDVQAHPRTAKLLAERLLELGVSAILDVYELNARDRILFVKEFLNGLVGSRKDLWHPALVVVDEAHIFCPEKKKGSQAESHDAVIDLMTLGRKRGFCGVLATQRIAKLDKDAAAECNNTLIGRTRLDADVKRAADDIGLGKEQAHALRHLKPGTFWASGPAFDESETFILPIGNVKTRHPKAGARIALKPPPAPEAVKAILSKLASIPIEQDAREKTVEDLKAEIATLKKQRVEFSTDVYFTKHEGFERIQKENKGLRDDAERLSRTNNELQRFAENVINSCETLVVKARNINRPITKPFTNGEMHPRPFNRLPKHLPPNIREEPPFIVTPTELDRINREDGIKLAQRAVDRSILGSGAKMPVGERKILIAIQHAQDGATREMLTVVTGYKRSSRDTYLQRLLAKLWIVQSETGRFHATSEGFAALGHHEALPTGAKLYEHWKETLPKGESAVMEAISYGWNTRDDISKKTGYQRSSRDTYLQRLRAREIIFEENGKFEIAHALRGP